MMISIGCLVSTRQLVADAGGAGIGMADDVGLSPAPKSGETGHPKGVELF
jgi:hypothetical protein